MSSVNTKSKFKNDVQQAGATRRIKSLMELEGVCSYLNRIGAKPRTLRSAVISERAGAYWRDIAVIRFSRSGEVDAPDGYEPTDVEKAVISADMITVLWPRIQPLKTLRNLPDAIGKADSKDVFEFRNTDGEIVMLQVRGTKKGGEKAYVPWTFWDDGEWRAMEPDGYLPLWGLEQLENHSIVFIHEGAKAARHCRWMVEGKTPEARQALKEHPWGEELSGAAHLGWIGGAPNPTRTDWSVLKRRGVTKAYIVADNDEIGFAAVSTISRLIDIPARHVQFTSEWRGGFDLADPFPERMFESIGTTTYYVGPEFRSVLQPATWATDEISIGSKTVPVLRPAFAREWAYIDGVNRFVSVEGDNALLDRGQFNAKMRAFSHATDTAGLLLKHYRGRRLSLAYEPGLKDRFITVDDVSSVNLYRAPNVKAVAGDIGPFERFLIYLIPDEGERREVKRWLFTLVGRPAVRMEYGLLLTSQMQGVGKSTIANIAAGLVGLHNTSFPSERDIVDSNFNSWLARKRLVVANEIYSGHSWKAYHRLKSFVTDRHVHVNEKFQPEYVLRNWAHFIICSNTNLALKVEEDDRRWFMPKLTEVKWPREEFDDFHAWLRTAGLSIILHHTQEYDDYVRAGEAAPMTLSKRQAIEDSRSPASVAAMDLARALNEAREPKALSNSSIITWVKAQLSGERSFDTDRMLRKAMTAEGAHVFEKRVNISGRVQYVVINQAAATHLEAAGSDEQVRLVRSWMTSPESVLPSPM